MCQPPSSVYPPPSLPYKGGGQSDKGREAGELPFLYRPPVGHPLHRHGTCRRFSPPTHRPACAADPLPPAAARRRSSLALPPAADLNAPPLLSLPPAGCYASSLLSRRRCARRPWRGRRQPLHSASGLPPPPLCHEDEGEPRGIRGRSKSGEGEGRGVGELELAILPARPRRPLSADTCSALLPLPRRRSPSSSCQE